MDTDINRTIITDQHLGKEAALQSRCSLCGSLYHNFAFKGGYICESCLDSIKSQNASHYDACEKRS